MSFHAYMRQNQLRALPGKHTLFVGPGGQVTAVRTHATRADFRGEELGGEYAGEELGAVPPRRGMNVLTNYESFSPTYMAGPDQAFTPSYMGDGANMNGIYDGNGNYLGEASDFGMDFGAEMGADFGAAVAPNRQHNFNPAAIQRGTPGIPGVFWGPQRRQAFHAQVAAAQAAQAQAVARAVDAEHVNIAGRVPAGWASTVLTGRTTLAAAGQATVTIRLQHDFLAQDLVFDGSLAGTTVSGVFFGDRQVWSTPNGVPITVFASSGMVRQFLNGQRIVAGLDIQVTGTLTGAGDLVVTVTGSKPYAVPLGS